MIRFPAQWADLTTVDFAGGALKDALAILPVAAVEQHGPHLPLSTDVIINQGIMDAACALLPIDLPVVVLPMQAIGTSHEHMAFQGTLTFQARTLIGLWTEIGESVARAGLRKLLIFNSHGGQTGVPELVGTDLRARLGMVVSWATPGAFGTPHGALDRVEAVHGLHGGAKETAMMLHLRPELVRLGAVARFPSAGEAMETEFTRLRATGRSGFAWQTQDLNAAGVVGDATAATAQLGKQLVDHAAGGLAELIADLIRFELPRR